LLRPVFEILLIFFLLFGQMSPDRRVENNTITSAHDPEVKIHLPKSAVYLGGDRWVLHDMADCELHAFIDGDSEKRVQRLYWVQFEAYVATRPELHHLYDSPRHTKIGGLDFYVDTWVRARDADMRPGSDLEHILRLIRSKGYQMPEGMMYVRLVHLLDEAKRKELMIIYAEDLQPTGYKAGDLGSQGHAHDHWPAIEKGLLERASWATRICRKGSTTLGDLDSPGWYW
jgi:hypothetical protein